MDLSRASHVYHAVTTMASSEAVMVPYTAALVTGIAVLGALYGGRIIKKLYYTEESPLHEKLKHISSGLLVARVAFYLKSNGLGALPARLGIAFMLLNDALPLEAKVALCFVVAIACYCCSKYSLSKAS